VFISDYRGGMPKENLTFKSGDIVLSVQCLTFCSCLHPEPVRLLFCIFSLKLKLPKKGGKTLPAGHVR